MSLNPVTKDQRKFVKDDIKMDDTQMKNKVEQIRDWMKKQPHLPKVPDEIANKMLFSYLVGTKMSVEKAKFKLDTYYAMRHQVPEVFYNRDPTQQDMRDSVDKIRYFPVSELTKDCIRVTILSYNNEEHKRFTVKDLIASYKRTTSIIDARMQQGDFCCGDYLVVDCRGFYKSHLTETPWPLVQKFTSLIQDAHPLRVKGVFLVYAPSYAEFVLNLLKPVLREKIRNRFHVFQGDYTNLYKFITKEVLPSDFGGNGPTIAESSEAWQKTIESMRDFFVEDTKRKTDEAKRPADSPSNCGQMFGVNGSFSKLTID